MQIDLFASQTATYFDEGAKKRPEATKTPDSSDARIRLRNQNRLQDKQA